MKRETRKKTCLIEWQKKTPLFSPLAPMAHTKGVLCRSARSSSDVMHIAQQHAVQRQTKKCTSRGYGDLPFFVFFFNFLRFCPQPFFAWVIISINFCCLLWCVWCGLHGHGVQVLPIAIHQICSDTRQNSILSAVADKQLQWSARHHNHTEERVNGRKELAARRVKYKYDRYIFTCADNRRSFSFFFFVIIDAWKCRLPKCFFRKFFTVAQWRNTAYVINDRPFIMVRFNCGRVIDRSQHIETENYRLGDNQSSLCPVSARRENFTAV